MPGGDGTGPNGTYNNCMPTDEPNFGRGRGFGRRSQGMGGRGRGRMNRFYATGQPGWMRYENNYRAPAEEDTIDSLRKEIEGLEKRLKELENKE
ncbi:MAG: DUF5320 family protein [Candidatus Nanoarchaeia archaeon]|nr:DUF5320 family protein [Candidatus Nanoarchaeia archaeon]